MIYRKLSPELRCPFIAAVALGVFSTIGNAQPQFEAASVKVVEAAGPVEMNSDSGRIDYRHIGIKALVWVAYPLTTYQIVWPRGLVGNAKFYDVSATFAAGSTKEQVQLMLQGLLADRFRLKAHWETRETPVYILEVSKRGLKIHKAENPPDASTLSISVRNAQDGWHLNDRLPNASASAPSGITITKLIQYVNNNFILDRMLVDKTGLEGYYDINLFIAPDASATGTASGAAPDAARLIAAMESQTGLRMEKQTAAVKTLVIDHLETVPAEN